MRLTAFYSSLSDLDAVALSVCAFRPMCPFTDPRSPRKIVVSASHTLFCPSALFSRPVARHVHRCLGSPHGPHTFAGYPPNSPRTCGLCCCHAFVARMSGVTTTTAPSWQVTLSDPILPSASCPTLLPHVFLICVCCDPLRPPVLTFSYQYIPFVSCLSQAVPILLSS